MSLQEILEIERNRTRREQVVLTTIYDRMKNRINNSVRVKSKDCVYTIPEFLPGYPLPNIEKTSMYLVTKLEKEGFIAIPFERVYIYITWDPVKISELDAKKPKEENNTYTKFKKTAIERSIKVDNEAFLDKIIRKTNK